MSHFKSSDPDFQKSASSPKTNKKDDCDNALDVNQRTQHKPQSCQPPVSKFKKVQEPRRDTSDAKKTSINTFGADLVPTSVPDIVAPPAIKKGFKIPKLPLKAPKKNAVEEKQSRLLENPHKYLESTKPSLENVKNPDNLSSCSGGIRLTIEGPTSNNRLPKNNAIKVAQETTGKKITPSPELTRTRVSKNKPLSSTSCSRDNIPSAGKTNVKTPIDKKRKRTPSPESPRTSRIVTRKAPKRREAKRRPTKSPASQWVLSDTRTFQKIVSCPSDSSLPTGPPANKEFYITSQTVWYTNHKRRKVWICPRCGKDDDGTKMKACSNDDCCDRGKGSSPDDGDWYHIACVEINSANSSSSEEDDSEWFCPRCTKNGKTYLKK